MRKILGCLQPTYLPWIPFFERIILSDIFVILDDVQFSKNSNHNRNYIKSNSKKLLLTVPIISESNRMISDIKIDNKKNWKKKHWYSILQTYGKSNFFKQIKNELEFIYSKDWEFLSSLNIEIIKLFIKYLNIKSEIYISSEIDVKGTSNQKLINICKYFNVDKFIVKKNTEHYHPKKQFLDNNIEFKYFSNKMIEYNQQGNNFVPGLSIIDYISNCGPSLNKKLIK
tara:strand:- start:115 stop:795 length:681 start_codon:yes stop_codon:yes gene_type:complete